MDFTPGSDHVLIPVNLRTPQADVIRMVAEIHRRERIKRNLPEQGGRRKKEDACAWEAIELLDREYFLGQQIKASEKRLIESVINIYRLACESGGLMVPS